MKKLLNSRASVFASYTVIFFALYVFIFASMIIQGKSLVAYGDSFNECYTTLQYVGNLLKTGKFSAYDTTLGFGDEVIGTLSWLGLGDVLLFPAICFPQEQMSYAYTFIAVMKMWLSGLAFIIYARYRNCDSFLSVAGGIAYAYSFYMLQMGLSYYLFLTAPVYFPLIVLGIDRIWNEKKSVLNIVFLAIIVCLQALNGFYFLYDDILACFFYCLAILVMRTRKGIVFSESLRRGGAIALSFIIGCTMAAGILVPSISQFLQSKRTTESKNVLHKLLELPSWEDLILRLKNMVFPAYSLYEYGFGLPILVIIVFVWLVIHYNKNLFKLILFCVVTWGYFFPTLGTAMNGFSYNTHRWLYIAFFTMIAISIKELPMISSSCTKQELKIFAIVCGLLAIVYIPIGNGQKYQVIIRTIIELMVVILSLWTIWNKEIRLIALALIANVALTGCMFFFPVIIGGQGAAASFMPYSEIYSNVFESKLYQLSQKAKENNTGDYYRIDFNDSALDAAAIMDVNSTYLYYSLCNGYIMNIFEKLRVSPAIEGAIVIKGLDSRQVLESLFSVRTYTERYDEDAFPKKNDYYLPMGLFYSNVISEDKANEYNYFQRMNLLMDTLIIKDYKNNTEVENNLGKQVDIPCTLTKCSDVEIKDNHVIVAKKNGEITISFDPIQVNNDYDEIYLKIDNLQLRTDMLWSDIDLAGRSIRTSPVNELYYLNGNYDYIINISSVAEEGILKLNFEHGGEFSFDNIGIVYNVNDEFEEAYKERQEHVLHNLMCQNGEISGTTNETTEGFLMINLPYSKKWKCYVDGVEKKVEIADYSFMAVYLEAGEHDVKFIYH